MTDIRKQVTEQLSQLIGLKLSIARRAADMRGFHFGRLTLRPDGKGSVGEFALHIQCPWRIDGPDGIVTGDGDLWDSAEPDEEVDWDTWHYDENENLQDWQIAALLGGYDPSTRSFTNDTGFLVVEGVEADDFGGATVTLSGGYRLSIFPSGGVGEDWRLFRPSAPSHFVVRGGRIETSTDDPT